jgi:hypothetical protein
LELNYNRIPYCRLGNIPKQDNALLFSTEAYDAFKEKPTPRRIYGACYCKKMEFADRDYWVLEWIWLHPFFRNRGNLKKHWGYLEEVFEDFLINKPISHDMKAFLGSVKSKYKHDII